MSCIKYALAGLFGCVGTAVLAVANAVGDAGGDRGLVIFPPGVDAVSAAYAAGAPVIEGARFANLAHTAALSREQRRHLMRAGALLVLNGDFLTGCGVDPKARAERKPASKDIS